MLFIVFICSFNVHSQDIESAKERNREFNLMVQSNHDSAIYLGQKLIREYKAVEEYKPLLSRVYLSMGNYYKERGDLPKAIEFYQLTEDNAIKFKDTVFIAYAKGSIGFVYSRTGQYNLALEVYKKNLQLWQQRNDPMWIPTACHNIIKCLNAIDSSVAVPHYIEYGLSVADSFNIERGKSDLEYDQADYLFRQDSSELLSEIKFWLAKSKLTAKAMNDRDQIDKVYLFQAKVNLRAGLTEQADSLCQLVFDRLDKLSTSRPLYLESCNCLVKTRQSLGRKEDAMSMMWHLANTNDSLSELSKVNKLSRLEVNHGLYKESLKDSLNSVYRQNEARMKLAAEKEKHQLITWVGILVALMVFSLAVYLFRNYRIRKSALKELEIVTKEIKDSINYAFRIQNAFLPKPALLNDWVDDAFVLYLPKDVVAGDFYWFEEVGDWVVVACADCTGHGVPGAMVSVVCHSALQKALGHCGPENPAAILDKTSELIAERFMLEKTPMKDGMDIGLCCFNKSSFELNFAGANNPLWLIKDGAISEVKGDRQPVGYHEEKTKFTEYKYNLNKGDSIYLTSDGYADQFGGGSGKKFKSKSLKKLILEQSQSSMEKQKAHLESEFYNWMDGFEQLDDVCIIGLRV
jgi:serine phosphatase RsbU (regulator of sigma subunit)